MGLVDFDVLDGVEEFLDACALLGLRAAAGFETRVFVPEFASRVITSPGEPGITYQLGVGFTSSAVKDATLLYRMKDIAQTRNRNVIARVNPYLAPVTLDYERDLAPLTPNGNATERHVCTAYDEKSKQVFPDPEQRAAFWAEKLHLDLASVRAKLDDGPVLQGWIRSKTMKAGGVGYVPPEGGDFPLLEEVNRFALENGAIPTLAWVDGLSAGEQAIDELLDLMAATGVAGVTIIPERNWNFKKPEDRKLKGENLHAFMAICRARHLPVFVGTEMNAYGQRYVDKFDEPELEPLFGQFEEGMRILHAHTLLHAHAGMGYVSEWANSQFPDVAAKNRFFAALGQKCLTAKEGAFLLLAPSISAAKAAAALGLNYKES
jgi:hypothetical protein